MFGFSKKEPSIFSPISWIFRQILVADKEYVAEQERKARDKIKRRCGRK